MNHTVDLHTHILPDVDDGAENISEAFEMLSNAVQNGTTDIVLTPHYLTNDMRSFGLSKDEIYERFTHFKNKAYERFKDINLYLGAEVFAVNHIEKIIEEGMLISINDTKYILIEFAFDDQSLRVELIIDKLIRLGYIPLIAHPERYGFIQRNPIDILRLLNKGALLQINSMSLAGRNGRIAQEIAYSYLANNMATAVSSDCHSCYQRTPDLSEVHSFISINFSSALAEKLLYDNPKAIIQGKNI